MAKQILRIIESVLEQSESLCMDSQEDRQALLESIDAALNRTSESDKAHYVHSFDFAIQVKTCERHGDDVTGAMLRAELTKRVSELSDVELKESCICFANEEA